MKLLLAEDEKDYCRVLTAMLERANFAVDTVYNGQDALDYGLRGRYDGIILDILMPGLDGLAVVRGLRHAGVDTPVMMLTAKTRMDDRIAGYDAGADDYLPKPFHAQELLSRVRALVRRRPTFVPDVLRFGSIVLNSTASTLTGPKGSVSLTGKEYQMLELLVRSPGHTVSTERFMETIWGWDSPAELNVVWVHMSSLRKKLVKVTDGEEIRASRGVGYSLVCGGDES